MLDHRWVVPLGLRGEVGDAESNVEVAGLLPVLAGLAGLAGGVAGVAESLTGADLLFIRAPG